jgi:hypothetical protein
VACDDLRATAPEAGAAARRRVCDRREPWTAQKRLDHDQEKRALVFRPIMVQILESITFIIAERIRSAMIVI